MDNNIGRKLDGRYEITELIGEGGMANVYKATDNVEKKTVAVKILKKEFAENEEFLRRFRNESKAIAVLSHPNIVKVFDVGFSDKIQFIVMEYIDGITLKEYMEQKGTLTWKDSVHFIIQVLRALQHAHTKGIVHRDIKPQNIMKFDDGTIKVMDFGIAKFAREDGKTAADQAIGSVHYISPEQAGGGVTNEKSDIYSVGVMFYEMLTGQKPFDTDNPVSVAVMHMQSKAVPPREVNPDIPRELERIIMKAMEKDPEKRYQSALDMIRDIEHFKNNPETVSAKASTAKVKTSKGSSSGSTRYFSPVEPDEKTEPDYDDYDYDDDNNYEDEYEDEEYYDEPYEEEEEEEEEERSLFIYVLTAVIIVFIIVAVIFFTSLIKDIFGTGSVTSNREFQMIDLVGMNYNEVMEKYPELDINITGSSYSEYEVDAIIEQSVEPGTTVKKGVEVDVKISKGVKMVKVPSVINMDYTTAQTALEQEGLIADIKFMTHEEIEEDYVIKTEPEAKTEVEPGSRVVVYVSKGPFITTVIVPNFVGMTEEEAKARCTYEELEWEIIERDSTEPIGTVIAQSLEPDTKVDSGTKVTLTISNGNAPSASVPVTIPIPSNASGTFKFVLYVEGVPTVEKSNVNAMYASTVTLTVDGTGTQVVLVELTNQDNNMTSVIGKYTVDFTNQTFSPLSEKINDAFAEVDGLYKETEPPVTEAETIPEQTWWSPETQAATEPVATEPVVTEPVAENPPQDNPDNAGQENNQDANADPNVQQ